MRISYRKYFRTKTLLKHHIEVLAQIELVTCLVLFSMQYKRRHSADPEHCSMERKVTFLVENDTFNIISFPFFSKEAFYCIADLIPETK